MVSGVIVERDFEYQIMDPSDLLGMSLVLENKVCFSFKIFPSFMFQLPYISMGIFIIQSIVLVFHS